MSAAVIQLMDFNTCKKALVPANRIVSIEEGSVMHNQRCYPYSDVHIVLSNEKLDYYLRVVESKKRILELINQAKEKKNAENK